MCELTKQVKLIAVLAVLLMPNFSLAKENTNDDTLSYTVSSDSENDYNLYDEYVREGTQLNVTFINKGSPVLDENGYIVLNTDGTAQKETATTTVSLVCDGDSLNQQGAKTGDKAATWGGWKIVDGDTTQGTCYGITFNPEIAGDLDVRTRSRCDETSDLSPDEKDYCVYNAQDDGSYEITGQTGDDMFQIKPDGSGFLEYLKLGDVAANYRLRYLSRADSNDANSGASMMIPSGPLVTFSDYKAFMNRYLDGSSSEPVRVEKSCYPIDVVVCSNQPPEALSDSLTMEEETTATFDVLGNDSDDGGVVFVTAYTKPDTGTLTYNGSATFSCSEATCTRTSALNAAASNEGSFSYTPVDNFWGAKDFAYTITDDMSDSRSATVAVNVTDRVEIQGGTSAGEMDEETVATFNLMDQFYNPYDYSLSLSGDITYNDRDKGTFSAGSLTKNTDGTYTLNLTYTPNDNDHTDVTAYYTICDNHSTCRDLSYAITVDDIGEITDGTHSISLNEDTSEEFAALTVSGITNPSKHPLAVSKVTTDPSHGSVTINAAKTKVEYTPDADYNGSDSFVYEFCDDHSTCAETSVAVTVDAVPDIAVKDDAYEVTTWNFEASVAMNLLANDSGDGIRIVDCGGIPNCNSAGKFKSIWGDGTHTYTYTAQVSNGETAQATVTVVIHDLFFMRDPLIIDLDGDGIELTGADDTTARFDIDVTGEAVEMSGWVSSDDAFLVLDLNANGLIDDKSELFGDADGFADGFANLASYDDNKDSVIDMGDDIYASLQLWQDSDSDGETDEGELFSLSDLISSISLSFEIVDNIINGTLETMRSSFTFNDGTEGQISDVWFGAGKSSDAETIADVDE